MTTLMAYFLIAFELKYMKGDIYMNALVACVAELIGKLSASPLLIKMGLKPLYFFSFSVAIAGAICLAFFSQISAGWTAAFILVTRFGASQAIVGAYLGIVLLFPTQLVSTAMGICNFFGRFLTILAPLLTEVSAPWPMLTLVILLICSLLSACCIKV